MHAHNARPLVESLEGRRLMSASLAALHGHTLFITGSGRGSNDIIVYRATTDGTIAVGVSVTDARTGATTNTSYSFAEADVGRVFVKGGKFDDTIVVGRADADWKVPVIVVAGRGTNDITTGGGDDVILTGDGNDTVDAGDGDNLVKTGNGDDTVTTGAGADRISTNAGNDHISSGGGDDLLFSGKGDDTVDAGDGNDEVHGGLGNDVIHGGAGNDVLWGGLGDDVIYGEGGDDKLGGILGYNTLVGGDGHDTFVVTSLDTNSHDYNSADDIVSLVKTHADASDVVTV
jgi:Ca2+-binding RTX toxin-like protein